MQSASGRIAAGSVGSTQVERAAQRVGRVLGRLDLITARIKPWMVLGPLVLAGWGVMLYVAHAAVHNGTLYYDGGDGTWYYTTAWELAHGHIPIANISYGYPMLIAPIAGIAGSNLLVGLPFVIVFNGLVLAPVALLCTYGIAKLLAGQRFAYLVASLWVVAPVLAIHYFLADYHRRYVGQTLPAVLGLTALGDFPSMVILLVTAYFGLRAMFDGRSVDALTAGLAAGLALAVKPANAIFLAAPLVAFLLARRLRCLLPFAAGLVPSVLCLVIWKYRGLGELPLFANHAEALAMGGAATPVAVTVHLSHYLPFNWNKFAHNIDGFREFTWSRRMIEWSVVAGLIGLGRRSVAVAGFLAVWLATYLVMKGGSVADFYGGGFFRYMAPAYPAAFLLVMSLPFLVPIYGPKLGAHGSTATWPRTDKARRWVTGVGMFLAVSPLIPLLAFPRQTSASSIDIPVVSQFVPGNQFALQTTQTGGRVTLTWPDESANGTRVRYAIFRGPTDQLVCSTPHGGAVSCTFPTTDVRTVATTSWADTPGSGTWVYRVMVISGPNGPITTGADNILLSRAATVTVPG